MRIERLWLEDFRCHRSLEVVFDAQVTVLSGGNGCGKTSALESLAWLTARRSFRGAPDASLVRVGAEHAIVRAEVAADPGSVPVLVEAQITRAGKNEVRVNRSVLRGGHGRQAMPISAVTFAPDDLELVQGGPGLRRDYLDDLLVEVTPRYEAIRRDLERVLLQRGRLLRSGMRGPDDHATLDVWDAKLVEGGSALVAGRLELLEQLRGPVAAAYRRIAGCDTPAGTVAVAYRSSWLRGDDGVVTRAWAAEQLAEALRATRQADLARQVTTAGPHRDDVSLAVGGLDARYQASQGEQRTLALALRVGAWQTIADRTGAEALLLLDDVFSELDAGRAAALVASLPSAQTVLTTASVPPAGLEVGRTIVLGGGTSPPPTLAAHTSERS